VPAGGDIRVNDRVVIPASEVRIAFARSGGPGGQNVNKVESKAELRWSPAATSAVTGEQRDYLLSRLAGKLTLDGELIVTSTLTRDQIRNRADAEAKLAAIVVAALHKPKTRRATKPSRGAKERRIKAKKIRGDIKRGRRGGDE
jgi:ribosome-associated protein